jgi:hypothetical protein
MIGNVTAITVSDSNDGLHIVRVMSERLEGWMRNIPEVEIWRNVLLSMFLRSLFYHSLYFIADFDLCPHQMASAQVCTTCRDESNGGAVSRCTGCAEWLPYSMESVWVL